MAYTFLNVQDRALDFNYGTADRTRIKTFINMAYRDLIKRHRWSWLEESTTVTTTAGQVSTSLSGVTDLMEFGRLRRASATTSVDPEYIDWNEWSKDFHRNVASQLPQGTPTKYSYWEGVIYWDKTPDATYTYTLYYWKRPVDLSADADVPLIPEQERDVLVFGALYYAALRDNDLPRMNQYQQLYEGMVAQMWRSDNLKQKQTPRKIRMPRSYGGSYE